MTGISEIPPRNAARIAGLTYILIILIGVLKVNFIEPAVLMAGNNDLVNNILENAELFRIGIASEIVMYLLVIVLSVSLYLILRPVDKDFAMSALLFRFGEAVIGSISVILSGLIPLLFVSNSSVFDESQTRTLVETFLNLRVAGLNIVLVFIGVGGTIYCYLFYRSWFVPRVLAAWGIFTYISMFILGFLNILIPDRPGMIETVLFSFGGLFEVVFGFWLLIKGINIEKWNTLVEDGVSTTT